MTDKQKRAQSPAEVAVKELMETGRLNDPLQDRIAIDKTEAIDIINEAFAEKDEQFDAMAALICFVLGDKSFDTVTQKASDLKLLKDFCLILEITEAAKRHEGEEG